MASFFRPQHYYNVPEPNFQGLFRLIDDFDRYSGQSSNGAGRGRNGLGSFFTPKFDMTETEMAYELHGELPGIHKEDIHMEFTDPQTLQIRGKVERTRTEGNPPTGLLEGTSDANKSDVNAMRAKYARTYLLVLRLDLLLRGFEQRLLPLQFGQHALVLGLHPLHFP